MCGKVDSFDRLRGLSSSSERPEAEPGNPVAKPGNPVAATEPVKALALYSWCESHKKTVTIAKIGLVAILAILGLILILASAGILALPVVAAALSSAQMLHLGIGLCSASAGAGLAFSGIGCITHYSAPRNN